MKYRKLGNSGLKVSEIGLGGNNFGEDQRKPWGIDEKTSVYLIQQALDLGINFIDTADFYGNCGRSEEFIGKAIKGKRQQTIVATKFGFPRGLGPNESGGSRHSIMEAVEGSLRRLNTDYIDLYLMHRPDSDTPIEETLRALDDLVRVGKVRYLGCSNFAAWQLSDALWTSKTNGLESFITVQRLYNILDRSIEDEIVPCSLHHGLGVIPWGPLASGLLTGAYRKGEPAPPGSRFDNPAAIFSKFWSDTYFDKVGLLDEFAKGRGHSIAELAIAWLLSHPWISSIIAGIDKVDQLLINIEASKWKLTAEELAEVNKITVA